MAEIAEKDGKRVVEKTSRGRRGLFVDGDDVSLPYDYAKRRLTSPLFPYQTFATKKEFAERVLEEGVSLARRTEA